MAFGWCFKIVHSQLQSIVLLGSVGRHAQIWNTTCETNPDRSERSLVAAFAPLEYPRCPINRRHLLNEVVVIAIAAVLGGADDWVDVEEFAEAKDDWFRQFLTLPHGIPSHDTFGRVFGVLDPHAFEACFRSWVAAICELAPDPNRFSGVWSWVC